MAYDIITFGSAAQDVNVKSKAFQILKNEAHEAQTYLFEFF